MDKEYLYPGLKLAELLNTDLKDNSDESPLFVKIFPTLDQAMSKTIYFRDTDEDGDFTGRYLRYEIECKEDLRDVYKFGRGLISLSNPKHVILQFSEIKDGERYEVYR